MATGTAVNRHKNEVRVSVVFAKRDASGKATKSSKRQGTRALLIQVFESTAKDHDMPIAAPADKGQRKSDNKTSTTKTDQSKPTLGSKGGKSMKIPSPVRKDQNNNPRLDSIPVPSGATVADMIDFAKKLKSKPRFIITPGGIKITIDDKAGKAAK